MAFVIRSNVAKLDARLDALAKVPQQRASAKALRAGANVIARKARLKAPVGKTGNLKTSVRVKPTKLKGSGRRGPNTGIKVTVAAPHGAIVTLGTQFRIRKRIGGFLAWKGPGPDPRTKETGLIGQAGTGRRGRRLKGRQPFFKRAVIANQAEANRRVIETLSFEVEKAHLQGKGK